MKTAARRCFLFVKFVSATLLFAPRAVQAQAAGTAPAKSIAAALQPFVDNHSLAGAVTLVADSGEGVEPRSDRLRRRGGRQADAARYTLLDRFAVKTDHGNRAHDARGRRQGKTRRSRGKVPAGIQRPMAGRRAATLIISCSRSRNIT